MQNDALLQVHISYADELHRPDDFLLFHTIRLGTCQYKLPRE